MRAAYGYRMSRHESQPRLISDSSQILEAFRAVGAVSPDTSRSEADFPVFDPRTLRQLVEAGKLNEPSPGRFYIAPIRRTPQGVLRAMLFWVLVLLIPILCIKFVTVRK